MDEIIYNDLIAFTKIIIFQHPEFEPEDFVNDVYLELCDQPFDKKIFKDRIRKLFIVKTVYEKTTLYTTRDTTRVCSKCNKDKPVDEFRSTYNTIYTKGKGNAKDVVYPECRVCENKKVTEYNKANPEKAKETNKKAFNKYVDKNRDAWNKYLRDRDKQAKADLSDSYIRKLLKTKYSKEELNNNPLLIEEKRQKIIKKSKKINLVDK